MPASRQASFGANESTDLSHWLREGATRSISLLCSAAIATHGRFDAIDQDRGGKGLVKESIGAGFRGPSPYALTGEGRDKDKRDIIAPNSYDLQKVQTAHSRHLHIRNDARRVVQAS